MVTVGAVVAALAFALALAAAPAVAEEAPGARLTAEQQAVLIAAFQNSPVYEQACLLCHVNLTRADKNRVSDIIFSHGYHRGQFECSVCHSKFPHSPNGTVRPTMDGCFACHGLRHGPVGLVASDKCMDCHRTRREGNRPSFHVAGWEGKPHVEPSLKGLQTKCMMCHKGKFCDDCHIEQYVRWEPEPPLSYAYDPGEGCRSCHEQASLVRPGPEGVVKYDVTGLSESVHRDISCVKCHADFKYDDSEDQTLLWNVNAGLACMDCHDHEKQAGAYKRSVHWAGTQKIGGLASGNTDMANCGSCHGGHEIQSLDSEAASAALHASALQTCARSGCHEGFYDSYNDYYHGAAYKKGTPDAPACWDCHDAHGTLPSADPTSSVSAKNLPGTCAGGVATDMACHRGTSEKFVASAKHLIHKKLQVENLNPMRKFLRGVKDGFKRDNK